MAETIRDCALAGGEEAALQVVAVVSPEQPGWLAGEVRATRLQDCSEGVGVLIDFSLPEGTLEAAAWCRDTGTPLVSGVTGLEDTHFAALDEAGRRAPVLWAPNMSVGVNLLQSLCGEVARALGREARVQVHDVHHQWKKDAPSGTALALGQAVEAALGAGSAPVSYTSDRVGEVVGEHRVRFEWDGEVIELAHEARDRTLFARGAIAAALWLSRQAAGRYTARDWLSGR